MAVAYLKISMLYSRNCITPESGVPAEQMHAAQDGRTCPKEPKIKVTETEDLYI